MRSYQVHRPHDYDLDKGRYPVLLVLDGLEHFQHVSATVDLLEPGKIPQMLVVGIPNNNNSRYRDLSNIPAAPGASGLLKFITEELAPKIDRDYRTRPYRILVGWSSAGQYTLYSMLHAPQAFRGYIAIEPAFEGKREFPNAVIAFLNDTRDQNLNADVFLAMGDVLGSDMRRVWELSSAFQQRAWQLRDVRYALRNYPEESHMSIPLRAVQDGLLSIFDGWQIVDPFTLYEQGGLAAIEKHFTALAARTGLPTTIPDATLFDVYWNLFNRKRVTEAEQVLARALDFITEPGNAELRSSTIQAKRKHCPCGRHLEQAAASVSQLSRRTLDAQVLAGRRQRNPSGSSRVAEGSREIHRRLSARPASYSRSSAMATRFPARPRNSNLNCMHCPPGSSVSPSTATCMPMTASFRFELTLAGG